MSRSEAREAGLKRYTLSTPCVKGHVCDRYVCDNKCVECARLQLQERYRKNTEKEKIRSKVYRDTNIDQIKVRRKESVKQLRKEKPELFREYEKRKREKIKTDPVKLEKERKRQRDKQLRAYKNDPEKMKDRVRQYRTATPERIQQSRESCKRYKKENPDVIRELNEKHNSKDRAARLLRFPKWVSTDEMVKINQLYKEARSKGLQVDHIIPLQGKLVSGLHVLSNLQLLTRSENASKKNTFTIT